MQKEWKADVTPVTETDFLINKMLIEAVNSTFPSHGILAEEESDMKAGAEYVWVCDPVDGTMPFSHGVPICAFSLALVKDGESILGVVYDPFSDRLFSAVKNQGAMLNGNSISVSKIDTFKGALGDFEGGSSAHYDLFPMVRHLGMNEMTKLMKLSSFIYPSVLVAAGEFAFTLFPSKSTHDAAAVKIIVEEAGGKVTDIFGNEQRYDEPINGLIASNGILHDRLVELAKKFVEVRG
ncbi:MAG: inositol monophosphatase [Candidatus Magasanikbacteria bacterium]|nr:inositol monophosphatase [Candidatus Magasanikbacteria bacterium]